MATTQELGPSPPCLGTLCRLNDSRFNSSSTEAGVPVAHHRATARPLPKKVRTITGGGTQCLTNTIPTGEANSCLLAQQQPTISCIHGAPFPVGGILW
ncbi:hypothetical protein AVEN_191245-2 [Araneus ventricosus]|nr:hypothetical protein AVEN_191245-2 [Araneus ventricosus]